MATETTHAATDAAHAAQTHGSVGLPQLDFATWDSQIFWLAVSLVILYYLMSRIALPRIQDVIETRADTIADDLDRASEYRLKAEAAERAYEAALATARREAARIAAEARATVQKEIVEAIAEADTRIAARTAESEKRLAEVRASAAASVEAVATETAQALVAALLPGAASDETVAVAVRSRLG